MLGRYRWAKEMINPDESYNRLHDHMMAIGRERDWLQLEVQRLTDELKQTKKSINAARFTYRNMKATIEMLQTQLETANVELVKQWVANATEMP